MEALIVAAEDAKLRKHVLRAAGAILHFSTVPPGRRVPPPWGTAAIGAADVAARIGIREKVWKFGVGGATRVRVYAANLDLDPGEEGDDSPAIILLAAEVKSDGQEDWGAVRTAILALRKEDAS